MLSQMASILVIDDEVGMREGCRRALSPHGFRVSTAEHGVEGLRQLRENPFDLVLLDAMMPGMSGWKTFDKIKENESWKQIPVVFLTARTDRVAKNAGGFLGEDYVEKPFDIKDLKSRIDQLIHIESSEE